MTDESVPEQDETQNPEIESLIGLARQKSQAGRNSIFETVQDLFLQKKDGLSERERTLMSDILRQLIHQVEISVRKDVATRLAKRNDAPKELVLVLANDEIEVAHSLLVNSMVLHDADLIELVRHRAQAHQLAIAMRQSLSEEVSQSLADTGDIGVITKLIENEDAKISESLLDYLVAQSKTVDSFQNPLISRRDLPPTWRAGCTGGSRRRCARSFLSAIRSALLILTTQWKVLCWMRCMRLATPRRRKARAWIRRRRSTNRRNTG